MTRRGWCLTFATVLPHCRQFARLQHNNYARSHLSALARRRCCWYRCWHLIGPVQRADVAYYNHDGPRRLRLYHISSDLEHCRKIRLLFHVRIWGLRRQLCHHRLGLSYSWPNIREEGCLAFHRQHCFDGLLHLHAISVSQERWAEVSDRDE